jgi:hypothetical protein
MSCCGVGEKVTSVAGNHPPKLELGFRLRQVDGLDHAVKRSPFVAAITERLALGMAATAEGESGASSQTECFSLLIKNLQVAFDNERTIICDSNLGGSHSNSLLTRIS